MQIIGDHFTVPASWPADARAKLDLLLERAKATHTDELSVAFGDSVFSWHSGRGEDPIQTMSVTKSIVGLAIGRLVTLGKLDSIETPVSVLFPEWRQGRKALITVRMLMEHTSGLQNVPITTEEIWPSPDFVQLALAAELVTDPGKAYSYNNKAVNLLAGIVKRADGRKLDDFTRMELLRPLGISDGEWMRDASGNPHAMSGLALHAEDLTRVGQLLLQRGRWQGSQLIDSAWFDVMDGPGDDKRESALMWWHVQQGNLTVADRHISAMRAAGVDPVIIAFFQRNQGKHASPMDLLVSARKSLGFWQERLPDGVQPFDFQQGRRLGYRAEGDLGQYVYAFNDTGLVISRLIRESTIEAVVPESRNPPASVEEHLERIEPFLFSDFENHAIALSQSLE